MYLPQTLCADFITPTAAALLHGNMFLEENVCHTKIEKLGCAAEGITERQMSKQKANSRLVLNITNENPF